MKRAIATVGGLGYLPKLPGTAGSAVGLGLAWLIGADPARLAAGALAVTALGLWSAGAAERVIGVKDPHAIIIDEVAGMMVALVALPVTWKVYLAGFLLFRLLDITKPLGLRRVERLPGSWGIMMDDLLAGALTHALVRAALPLLS